jgi:Zinc carboxypeptidase
MIRIILTGLLFLAALNAHAVDFSTAANLPPDLPWKGKSEKLMVPASDTWATPSEISKLTTSPSYAETRAFLERMAAASPLIKVQVFGVTPQGRELLVAIVSKDGANLDPAKPVALMQAGIHSGEIDGKDAGLMLLRDIAFKGKDKLIDRVNILFVPIFNLDGHERAGAFNRPNQRGPEAQGWRSTAQNLNLNRDYAKVDAPEMRAMIGLLRTYRPDFYMDLHVTDGMDYQYDITYGFQGRDGAWAASPNVAAWMQRVYVRDADKALSAMGHVPGPLIFERDPRDPGAGRQNDGFSPRFSQTYGDMIGMASVLVENHSLKNFKRRVLGTYVLLEQTLKTLARDGAGLKAAIAQDRAARPAQLPAGWSLSDKPVRNVEFLPVAYEKWTSPATGQEEIRWLGRAAKPTMIPLYEEAPTIQLQRPKAYWVPATKPEVIERLKVHGIAMETLSAPRTVRVDILRLPEAKPNARPNEGRFETVAGTPVIETQDAWFPTGSVRVSTDQPLGNLAMILLDPQSEDSFFAWGFFPEILQRTEYAEGYVMAPLAERMMAEDPKLKAAFEAKLAEDTEFAKNPRARLSWFYERTPYYDARYLLYPVGIER